MARRGRRSGNNSGGVLSLIIMGILLIFKPAWIMLNF